MERRKRAVWQGSGGTKLSLALLLIFKLGSSLQAEIGPAPSRIGSLVACGQEKVVVLDDLHRADENWALGWTLRPNRNQASVEWELYDPAHPKELLASYPVSYHDPSSGDYLLVLGIVDLGLGKFTPLTTTRPVSVWLDDGTAPFEHGETRITWSNDQSGIRHAVVTTRFAQGTNNFWLVKLAPGNVQATQIEPALHRAVREHVRRLRSHLPRHYAIELGGLDTYPGSSAPPSRNAFTEGSVFIRFDLFAGDAQAGEVHSPGGSGYCELNLKSGPILRFIDDKY